MVAGKHRMRVHCFLAAGRGIGLGHLTRTMAVAREIRALGAEVTLHLRLVRGGAGAVGHGLE